MPPPREEVRSIGGYVPSMYLDLTPQERKPPLETVQSAQPVEDARKLLTAFLPKAFRRELCGLSCEDRSGGFRPGEL